MGAEYVRRGGFMTKYFIKGMGILKYVLLFALFIFIAILLQDDKISTMSMDDVEAKVIKAVGWDGAVKADNRTVKRIYGINVNDYEDVRLYVSDSNMKVEELLLVRLRSTDQANEIEQAIQSRVDSQLESFEGYGPEQCELLNSHVLDVSGNYVLFVVNVNAQTADKAFQNAL